MIPDNAGSARKGRVADGPSHDDAALVCRILAGEEGAFERLMRRHNQRLFRVARSIVRNPADAEDVVQEAYLKAYRSLARFEGRSSLSTWLIRITRNEALTRAGQARRVVSLHGEAGDPMDIPDDSATTAGDRLGDAGRTPELGASDLELLSALSRAIDRLPESLRTVFVLRSVESMSVEETADSLRLSPQAVRVRLHRARAVLRREIDRDISKEARHLFLFGNRRCDLLVKRVVARIRLSGAGGRGSTPDRRGPMKLPSKTM